MNDELTRSVISRIVAQRAEWEPDRVALIFENEGFPDEVVRFSDLVIQGNKVAARLKHDGIAAGDRVALMLRNHPEFVYGLLASARLGAETVPIDPRARGEKLRYLVGFADSRAIIVADYIVADGDVARTLEELGTEIYVVSTPEGRAAGVDLGDRYPCLSESLDGPELGDVGEQVTNLDQPWFLSFTSGTTGDPKAILIPHRRLLLYAQIPSWFGYRDDDVPYTGLSLVHGNAIFVTLVPALSARVDHSVFSRWFTRSRLWEICREYGATSWSNLGGIATGVYSLPPSPRDRDHKVRVVLSAGMPRELWVPFEERYGVRVVEWYGSMEGGFAYHPIGFGPPGSFGKAPADTMVMDVVDEDDRSVEPGQPGELIARPLDSPAVVAYYKDPAASAKKVRDGWLRSGDIVTRDENGWLFFEHRKEEGGLRKQGEFISESFVRRVVAEYDRVVDVHIYGVPSALGAPGETDVVATIIVDDRETFDVDALLSHCRARLEPSHVPDIVQVVDDFPTTPSAKVQTRLLIRQLVEGGLLDASRVASDGVKRP